MDSIVHVLLFALAAFAIVFASATFHEPEDGPLWKSLPKRYGWFCLWMVLISVVMVIAEHTVASVH